MLRCLRYPGAQSELTPDSAPRFRISLLLAAFVMLSAVKAYSAVVPLDPKLKWRSITSEHFVVHYSEGLGEVARRAGAIAEDVHSRLAPQFGWSPRTKTHLIVTDISDFANGITTVFPYPTILIFVAPPQSEESLDNYDNWMYTLLTHEYSHVLIMDMTGGIPGILRHLFGRSIAMNAFVPQWWAEGVPTYEETRQTIMGRGRGTYTDMALRAAVLENKFPSPGSAGEGMIRWPAGESPYIFGVAFVSYLSDRFGDEKVYEFLRKYSRQIIPFRMNGTAKRIFGRDIYELWRDWENYLKKKYFAQQDAILSMGLAEGKPLTDSGYMVAYPVWDAKRGKVIYFRFDGHKSPAIFSADPKTGDTKKIFVAQVFGGMGISPDGNSLAYTRLVPYSGKKSLKYYLYTDIYINPLVKEKKFPAIPEAAPEEKLNGYQPPVDSEEYNPGEGKRLTAGERASDPDFSPDGEEIVYVSRRLEGSTLKRISIDGKDPEVLWEPPPGVLVDSPRWSPDGTLVAFSAHEDGGYRDIRIIDLETGEVRGITHDRAKNVDPEWSPDGRYILFSSDKTGVPNIYAFDTADGSFYRVTNVLTGAFQPAVSPDGKSFVYQGYTSKGFDLFVMDFDPSAWQSVEFAPQEPDPGRYVAPPPLTGPDRRYSPLSMLAPRFLIPTLWYNGVDYLLGLSTGGMDPLQEHAWSASATWGVYSEFLSWGAAYYNNQTAAGIYASVQQYSVGYGKILLSASDADNDGIILIPDELFYLDTYYYEVRTMGAVGAQYTLVEAGIPVTFGLSYYFENRDNITRLPTMVFDKLLPDRGNFAGLEAAYSVSLLEAYPYSISPEIGVSLDLRAEWIDKSMGSDYNQFIATGDLRYYIPVPLLRHHVLAFRAAGGIMDGDKLYQGTFRVGGTLGESVISAPGNKFFYLRGFRTNRFIGDRALVLTGEYRFPLLYPQRSLGMLPVFFQKIHGAFFADYGGAFDRKLKYPLTVDGRPLTDINTGQPIVLQFKKDEGWNLGVGAELRITGLLGWGMIGAPITGRLGFAQDIQGDGIGPVVYFDLGTPF